MEPIRCEHCWGLHDGSVAKECPVQEFRDWIQEHRQILRFAPDGSPRTPAEIMQLASLAGFDKRTIDTVFMDPRILDLGVKQ